ncbi:MAG: CBS domain-containing protein [Deltaproteobacteria bacterium]|nr:CBS domain-containing protein [Deltaproteobacteria bacterium]
MNAQEIKVRDVMNRDIKTITKVTQLMTAAKIMRDQGVSSLVIEPDDEMDAYGIVTRKDIVDALVENIMGGDSQLVEDAMTKPAISIHPDLSVYNCHHLMRMVGVRRLLVIDGTTLMGIISNSDIFNKMVEDI